MSRVLGILPSLGTMVDHPFRLCEANRFEIIMYLFTGKQELVVGLA